MHKLLSFLLILNVGTMAHGMDSSDAAIIQQLTEDTKTRYKAEEPWDVVKDIAQRAIKDCGITQPITILQTKSTHDSRVASAPFIHPQQFIVIGTKGRVKEHIQGAIYHELGHVAHNDGSKERHISDYRLAQGTKIASLFTGVGTGLSLIRYTRKPLASVAIGGITAMTTLFSGIALANYKQRIRERKADEFAYENLIKHGHLNSAILMISDFLYEHESDEKPLPLLLCDHPHGLERAKSGLDALQKQGIDIPHLIKNLPHDLDDRIKAYFSGAIQRFFPELCTETQESLK